MQITTHSPDHVSGTPAAIASRQAILANVAQWRRKRQRRQNHMDMAAGVPKTLNSLSSALRKAGVV